MRLAIWDMLAGALLHDTLAASRDAPPVDLRLLSPKACTEQLMQGQVDVALLPSLVVFTNPEAVDVLPTGAFSTWRYPYARIRLRQGLEQIQSMAFNPEDAQEALIARIIMREHYRKEPEFIPYEGATPETLLEASEDASLLVGGDVSMIHTEAITLNLGEEWFELVNYPMVWGLFATRRDEATPRAVNLLHALIEAAEVHRPVWLKAHDMTPEMHAYVADDLRLRLDDLATASLTEFRNYLHYYGVTDDIPEFPLYVLTDQGDDAEDDGPRLRI
jgi:predicted solute-binding protein